MHAIKKFFTVLGKTVKWCFIVFLVYLVSLCFRKEHIPGEWLEEFVNSHMPTNFVFGCEDASFGFGDGLRLEEVRLYDLSRKNKEEPMFSAETISVRPFSRVVKVVGAQFPRLQDSYYEVGGYAEPLGGGDWGVRLPKLPKFRLELVQCNILGAAPEFLRAMVSCKPTRLLCSEAHIVWGGDSHMAELDGYCEVNIATKRVQGIVKGEATQEKIRPLIEALDLPLVLEYMDAFTDVTKPVPASCAWDVDLASNEFTLDFDLHPELGRYNDVSMSRADGSIGLHVTFPVRDGVRDMDYETTIGPLNAVDNDNRSLKGKLVVRGAGDVAHIHFDAASTLRLQDILSIIDYLNEGELDCLVCDTPPVVKVKGILATDVSHQADNDLRGSVEFAKGSLFGISLWDASSDFSYIGDTVYFNKAVASGKCGGKVRGSAKLSFPGLDPEKATYSLDVSYVNGSVEEIADFVSFDAGDRSGEVEGEISIRGPIETNAIAHVAGTGHIKVKNGHIAQMKLFMGLTNILAREIPGVDKIVNQSEGSCTFELGDGFFRSDDILIEGSLFSIAAKGCYDMVNDNLDFTVRVQFLKNESVLGKYLIRPIMWPFTKLLLEFKATGPIDNPAWEYISVLDRIM